MISMKTWEKILRFHNFSTERRRHSRRQWLLLGSRQESRVQSSDSRHTWVGTETGIKRPLLNDNNRLHLKTRQDGQFSKVTGQVTYTRVSGLAGATEDKSTCIPAHPAPWVTLEPLRGGRWLCYSVSLCCRELTWQNATQAPVTCSDSAENTPDNWFLWQESQIWGSAPNM